MASPTAMMRLPSASLRATVAGLEHGRGVDLLEDRRAVDDARRAAASRGHRPACRARRRRTRPAASRGSASSSVAARPAGSISRRQVDCRPHADHRGVEVDQIGADLRQLDAGSARNRPSRTGSAASRASTSAEGSGTLRRCVWPRNCMSAEWMARIVSGCDRFLGDQRLALRCAGGRGSRATLRHRRARRPAG